MLTQTPFYQIYGNPDNGNQLLNCQITNRLVETTEIKTSMAADFDPDLGKGTDINIVYLLLLPVIVGALLLTAYCSVFCYQAYMMRRFQNLRRSQKGLQ